jgi:solute carrier family 8 (sodium/calcium exchanger)
MKAHEVERSIFIRIVDDNVPEPDQMFFVTLCDEKYKKRLPGIDTRSEITILDNDRAGVLRFSQDVFVVRPDDKKATIRIKRSDGADGIAVCSISTRTNHVALDGREVMQPNQEFIPIQDKLITF